MCLSFCLLVCLFGQSVSWSVSVSSWRSPKGITRKMQHRKSQEMQHRKWICVLKVLFYTSTYSRLSLSLPLVSCCTLYTLLCTLSLYYLCFVCSTVPLQLSACCVTLCLFHLSHAEPLSSLACRAPAPYTAARQRRHCSVCACALLVTRKSVLLSLLLAPLL